MKRIVILVMMLMMICGIASASDWVQTDETIYIKPESIKKTEVDGYTIVKAEVKYAGANESQWESLMWISPEMKAFIDVRYECYDKDGKLLFNGTRSPKRDTWESLPNKYWDKTIAEIIKRAN